jgi:hypothetical protein
VVVPDEAAPVEELLVAVAPPEEMLDDAPLEAEAAGAPPDELTDEPPVEPEVP